MTKIDLNSLTGLSEKEAERRLVAEGANELPSSKPKTVFDIAFDVVREPMFLLLVACGLLYLMLGDKEEALMLLGFVFVIMGITFFQERKTERALEALKDLSSPRALVIRDGVQRRIPGREVVRGIFSFLLKEIVCRLMLSCWILLIFLPMNRCSPAKQSRCESLPHRCHFLTAWAGLVVTIFHLSFLEPWLFQGKAQLKCLPLAAKPNWEK